MWICGQKHRLSKCLFLLLLFSTFNSTDVFAYDARKPVYPDPTAYPVASLKEGDRVLITWEGNFTPSVQAYIQLYLGPSTCSGTGPNMICTKDLRSFNVGIVDAGVRRFEWQVSSVDASAIAGTQGRGYLTVFIPPSSNVPLLVQVNSNYVPPSQESSPSQQVTDPPVDTTTGPPISPVPNPTPLSVSCKISHLNGQFHLNTFVSGGTVPYSHTWFDGNKAIHSLDDAANPGVHRISLQVKDRNDMITEAFCGEVSIATSTPDVPKDSCYINITANIGIGSRGENVKILQTFLKDNSHYTGYGTEVTGYFGVVTHRAVRKFQLLNAIETTGFVGSLTRAKIKEKSIYSCKTTN